MENGLRKSRFRRFLTSTNKIKSSQLSFHTVYLKRQTAMFSLFISLSSEDSCLLKKIPVLRKMPYLAAKRTQKITFWRFLASNQEDQICITQFPFCLSPRGKLHQFLYLFLYHPMLVNCSKIYPFYEKKLPYLEANWT